MAGVQLDWMCLPSLLEIGKYQQHDGKMKLKNKWMSSECYCVSFTEPLLSLNNLMCLLSKWLQSSSNATALLSLIGYVQGDCDSHCKLMSRENNESSVLKNKLQKEFSVYPNGCLNEAFTNLFSVLSITHLSIS